MEKLNAEKSRKMLVPMLLAALMFMGLAVAVQSFSVRQLEAEREDLINNWYELYSIDAGIRLRAADGFRSVSNYLNLPSLYSTTDTMLALDDATDKIIELNDIELELYYYFSETYGMGDKVYEDIVYKYYEQ